MENISEIKTGFINYLIDKYGEEASKEISSYSPDLSIFMYSSDFQTYLKENGYSDVSIFTKSISDIKDVLESGETNSVEEGSDTFVSESANGNAINDIQFQD